MVEAELKARLHDPEAVRRRLDERVAGSVENYRDTYFDTADEDLDREGRELRIRTISGGPRTSHLLTFKEPPVAGGEGSKPEYEVNIADPTAMGDVLRAMGYRPVLSFTKECVNYRLRHAGRDFLATLVTVPELDGTFLEVETAAEVADVEAALGAVRTIFADLGVGDDELTSQTYTGAVRAARHD